MPFSRLVTEVRVDLAAFRKDLQQLRKEAQAEMRLLEQTLRVRPGITGAGGTTGGRLQTIGGGTIGGGRSASQEIREEVRDRLASFAQIRQFRRDLSNQENQDFRTRRQQNATEERERQRRRSNDLRALRGDIQARAQEEARLDTIRRQAEARRQREAKAAAREAGAAEAFMTGSAQQGLRNFRFEQRERERTRREAETQARRDAAAQRQAERDRQRLFFREQLQSAAAGRSVRIDRPGGGFGVGGRGGIPTGGDIDAVTAKIRGGLTNALQRASNAAQQLNLLVGVSIFGGLGALAAEGFRLNSQLQKVNLTMAATLGITNDVVDAQGKLVDGPQRTNFLLEGTAGIYEQVRKIAAETILEQQELLETVAENLTLGQQAGFKLETLGPKETGPLVETIANVAQLAKAVGLPGGQRQLTQEVRALFLGERLQGATIARLLGFTSVQQIQELQQKPGQQPGTTAFADELKKRFARVKPILDEFQNSAQGVFTTLISQGRLFLQIFSQSAFNAVTGVGKELRNFLTDERIRATAEELGESFGNIVKSLIEVGRHLGPLVRLFSFLVGNAGTLVGLFTAFKGIQTVFRTVGIVQSLALAGRTTGIGAAASFLGGAGGVGGLGAVGGAAGRLSPARLAAIQFASAAGTFGLGGALRQQGGFARTVLTSPFGRGGIQLGARGADAGAGLRNLGLFTGATGLLGAPPAALILASGLLGGGLGLGTAALARRFGERAAGVAPVVERGKKFSEEQAAVAERITRLREQQRGLQERARRFEPTIGLPSDAEDRALASKQRLGAAARAGGFGSFVLDLLSQLAPEKPPELTQRVRPGLVAQQLRERAKQFGEEIRLEQKAGKELRDLQLQRNVDAEASQRIENALFLAQVRRNKEAEINLTAQLDKIKAVSEINDTRDRNDRILAIEEERVKKLRELREDELQDTEEASERALGNEEKLARLRARRRFTEIQREFQGRELTPELVTLRERQRATADLVAQREILTARIGRFSQRAAFGGQLAGVEGRALDQIRAEGFGAIAGAAQQVAERKISVTEFNRFVVAQNKRTQERIVEAQQEARNKGINLTNQFTEAVRRATDLQRDYELNLIRFKERVRDRDFQRTKQRLQEEVDLRRATQAKIDALVDRSLFDRTRGAQRAAFGVLTTRTSDRGGLSIEEQLQSRFQRQIGRARETRGLSEEQTAELASQRAREFIRGLVETLTGPGGVTEALQQLRAEGISLTRAEQQRLAGAGIEGGRLREDRTVFGEIREAQGVRERTLDAIRAEQDARDQAAQSAREDVQALREERLERQQANREFNEAKARLAQDFANIAQDTIKFGKEMDRARIVIDKELIPALRRAVSVVVPSPSTLAGQEAARAVAENRAQRRASPVERVRGFFEELLPEIVHAPIQPGLERAVPGFGQPGQSITGLGSLFGQPGDVGVQANQLISQMFESPNEQTVTQIPGVNLNGFSVSQETAALVRNSMQAPGDVNVALDMIKSTSPPFIGSPRNDEAAGDQRAFLGTTINIDLTGIQIGADTQQTIEKLGVQLQRDARRTPVS